MVELLPISGGWMVMMNSLAQAIQDLSADRQTIELAARFYLAEITDDLDVDDMRLRLADAVGSSQALAATLAELERNPQMLENSALIVLSDAFADENRRERVLEVLEDARGQMPVIEVGILAIIIMYGMYLRTTKGIKKAQHVTIRRADGSLEERDSVEYTSPTGPMSAITKFFG